MFNCLFYDDALYKSTFHHHHHHHHLLQAFSGVMFRTAVQHLTRFQLNSAMTCDLWPFDRKIDGFPWIHRRIFICHVWWSIAASVSEISCRKTDGHTDKRRWNHTPRLPSALIGLIMFDVWLVWRIQVFSCGLLLIVYFVYIFSSFLFFLFFCILFCMLYWFDLCSATVAYKRTHSASRGLSAIARYVHCGV